MTKLPLDQRLQVALEIVKGKTKGNIGKVTVCPDFLKEDGSPAHHQPHWELDTRDGTDSCDGDRCYRRTEHADPIT